MPTKPSRQRLVSSLAGNIKSSPVKQAAEAAVGGTATSRKGFVLETRPRPLPGARPEEHVHQLFDSTLKKQVIFI